QVRNPATGEMVWAAPKPARRVVKVRPLKALKDMAE
ncbi:MAG: HU family DNA-binding protein, partial [Planctomycetota bacterium]|nr:HU family DNA-binding protein [Planctomycetota bacterium]MEC8571900.1 HU family DNA-binding protein [Planctomycetota bacterium]MEE3075880.1 HU family DNA-binding protein [Planctomycetota bacterium]